MAKKPAKMANRQKSQNQGGTKMVYTVRGGPATHYDVLNAEGEVVESHIQMWDAIRDRDRRNSNA